MAVKTLYVSYSQISLFRSGIDNPFNDWSEEHVRQGFSWRDGAVSFGTLIESGDVEIEYVVSTEFRLSDGCERAISLPFKLDTSENIEIATLTESFVEPLEDGSYQLVYETGFNGTKPWCRFTVLSGGNLTPMILLADNGLKPIYPLLMKSEPA